MTVVNKRIKKIPIENKIIKFCLILNGFNNSKNINKKPIGIIDCINQIGNPIKLSVPYWNSLLTNKKLDKAKKRVTNKVTILENKNLKLKFIFDSISIKNQNKTEFLKLINQVLTYDIEKYPNQRLSNILAQERAQWLKSRMDLLFF